MRSRPGFPPTVGELAGPGERELLGEPLESWIIGGPLGAAVGRIKWDPADNGALPPSASFGA